MAANFESRNWKQNNFGSNFYTTPFYAKEAAPNFY